MKIYEIINNNLIDDMKSDIMDMLISYRRKNLDKISLHELITYLENLGYVGLDSAGILNLLNSGSFSKIVDHANVDNLYLVKLNNNDSQIDSTSELEKKQEKNIDKIDKDATDIAKKSIKSGELS